MVAVSSLSNTTARHARHDELDMSNVRFESCRDATSQVEFGLKIRQWLIIGSVGRSSYVGHVWNGGRDGDESDAWGSTVSRWRRACLAEIQRRRVQRMNRLHPTDDRLQCRTALVVRQQLNLNRPTQPRILRGVENEWKVRK